jgi:ribosomal protein S6
MEKTSKSNITPADKAAKKSEKMAQKQAKAAAKVAPRTDTSKVYELGYLLVPSIGNTALAKEEAALKDLFSSRGGELVSSESPVMIDLAYPMLKVVHTDREKATQAYFGWMKYEIETDQIIEIKKFLDASAPILRYLLVKTVRENTLLEGMMSLGKEEKKKFARLSDDGEEMAESDMAPIEGAIELDKSIDDLVIA